MKQVLMILASVMAVASGRMLQDENITSTLSNSSLIDEAVKPEIIDENENTSEVASPDEDNGDGADAITLWRVQPQPLPANYVITAQFKASDEDTQYGYTVAVAGVDASISPNTGPGSDDDDAPVLYFNLDQPFCDTNAMSPTSFQTSKFQIPDENSPTLSTALKVCWAAPPGYYISNGLPTDHRLIFHIFHHSLGEDNWTYDGTISTTEGKADVWKREYVDGGRDFLELSRKTGNPIKYSTRFRGIQIELEDLNLTDYDKPEDVPKARLTDEEKKECSVMKPLSSKHFEPCEECTGDLIQGAMDAFAAQLKTTSTGLINDYERGNAGFEPLNYPSTEKEYELIGSEEEQEKVNGLKSFLPGMVGRGMVPVRNQKNCGSCYSFGAAHTISSSYAQEHPDSEFLVFSNQHFMNCLPVGVGWDSNINKTVNWDGGTGCWGGLPSHVIDMVVYAGGKLPLLEVEPYIGFHSHCEWDTDNMVDTGITGYAKIKSIEEMKNALHFRGDVSVGLKADPILGVDLEDENIKLPPNDIELHEQANLGEGISYPFDEDTDHAVAIVGWGPCQVTHCKTNETIDDECWIMQNSWGPSAGYEGFYFIHTDPECDAGISSGAIIPLFDKVDTSSGEVSQSQPSYLFGLWLCSVANVVLYAILL